MSDISNPKGSWTIKECLSCGKRRVMKRFGKKCWKCKEEVMSM